MHLLRPMQGHTNGTVGMLNYGPLADAVVSDKNYDFLQALVPQKMRYGDVLNNQPAGDDAMGGGAAAVAAAANAFAGGGNMYGNDIGNVGGLYNANPVMGAAAGYPAAEAAMAHGGGGGGAMEGFEAAATSPATVAAPVGYNGGSIAPMVEMPETSIVTV